MLENSKNKDQVSVFFSLENTLKQKDIIILLIVIAIINFAFIRKGLYAQDLSQLPSTNPFSIGGSIGVNLSSYGAEGIQNRSKNFDYSLLGSLNLNIYGINIPFNATISDQNRSFTQPFNQYGASPYYKWVKLHAGYRNITFSPFTLAGHSFLGGGIELTPGSLRFGAVYGRFLRASEGDTNSYSPITPVYKRMGYSVKLGYGSATDNIDLIFLNAWDDSTSISNPTIKKNLKPAANKILGIRSAKSLWKNVFFEFDAAASLYTMDLRADPIIDSTADQTLKSINEIININSSSQLTSSLATSLIYKIKSFACRLNYKRIDPDYKSMGAYYSESDVQNITFAPTYSMLNNTLRLGGSIGWQTDNLSNLKRNSTNRLIGSFDASYQEQTYGVNLRYTSYGISQSKGYSMVIDTLKISRVNHNLNATGRYTLNLNSTSHLFLLNLGYQSLNDNNALTAPSSETSNYTALFSYNMAISEIGLTLSSNINYIHSIVANNINDFLGPAINATYSPKSDYSLGAGIAYQSQSYNSNKAADIINLQLNASYNITKNHSLRLDCNYLNNNSKTEQPSFSEARINLGYIYNFY